MPSEVLASVFSARPVDGGGMDRQQVGLANGDEAAVLMHSIRPGNADRLTREELQARLTELAQTTAGFELSSYAQHVRDAATVRIPDEVLNPPLY